MDESKEKHDFVIGTLRSPPADIGESCSVAYHFIGSRLSEVEDWQERQSTLWLDEVQYSGDSVCSPLSWKPPVGTCRGTKSCKQWLL